MNIQNLAEYVTKYYQLLDTQTLITICEQIIQDLQILKFHENYKLCLEQSDVHKVIARDDEIIFHLNNLGMLGMQSAAPAYILDLHLQESSAFISLINIFNDIIARLIYYAKSSLMLNYIDTSTLSNMNLLITLSTSHQIIYSYNHVSKFTLTAILHRYCHNKAHVKIEKLSMYQAKCEKSQMCIGQKLHRFIIGNKIIIPYYTAINLHIYDRQIYENAIYHQDLHVILQQLIPSKQYLLRIIADQCIHHQTIIGASKLSHGIHITNRS